MMNVPPSVRCIKVFFRCSSTGGTLATSAAAAPAGVGLSSSCQHIASHISAQLGLAIHPWVNARIKDLFLTHDLMILSPTS